MTALTWTHDRPTVPGWYWLRGGCNDAVEIVEVRGPDPWQQFWTVWNFAYDNPATVESVAVAGVEWAGPIPEPGR